MSSGIWGSGDIWHLREQIKSEMLELLAECRARLDANESDFLALHAPATKIALFAGHLGLSGPPIEFISIRPPAFHRLFSEYPHFNTVTCLRIHDPYGPSVTEVVLCATASPDYLGPFVQLPFPNEPTRKRLRALLDSWLRRAERVDVGAIEFPEPSRRAPGSLEELSYQAALVTAIKGPPTAADRRENDEFRELLDRPETARNVEAQMLKGAAQYQLVASIFPMEPREAADRTPPTAAEISDAMNEHNSRRASLSEIEHEILGDLRESPGRVEYIAIHTPRILADRYGNDPAKIDLARADATHKARSFPRHGGRTESHFKHKTTLVHPPNVGKWWDPTEVQDTLRDLRDREVIEWVPADQAGEFYLLENTARREPTWRLKRAIPTAEIPRAEWMPPPGMVGTKAITKDPRFQKNGKNPPRTTIDVWINRAEEAGSPVVKEYAPDSNEVFLPEVWVMDQIALWNPRT